jgi:hypothetical protein
MSTEYSALGVRGNCKRDTPRMPRHQGDMDFAQLVNGLPTGWVKEMGITILTATADEVTCELEVTEKHQQGSRTRADIA